METTQQAIAQAISVRLTRMGRNRSWLASEIGMNLTSLTNRLTGHTAIDTADIDRIAGALGLTGFDLIRLAAEEQQAGAA